MMTLEEMNRKKRELGYSYPTIAEKSGLPLSTVQKVLGGLVKAPRQSTLEQLSAVFQNANSTREDYSYYSKPSLYEGALNYGDKKQGEYTIEDYLALPEEDRVELIDGVFYEMAAPLTVHQTIAGAVFSQLRNYIHSHKGGCIPFIAPIDVQLDSDGKTMVQPDVLILCDRNKLSRERIHGAPDFVLEVLSPSTKKKDMFLKLKKYEEAGVREYWIVNPDKQIVLVYDFAHDDTVAIYPFDSRIPLGIYDGQAQVDFASIRDDLLELSLL